MTDVTIFGKTLDDDAQRDAVHIAVAPVTAIETVYPGQHVGLDYADAKKVTVRATHLIGIVDPFLTHPVPPGTRFWLFLYQNTITSLRHVWTHSDFEDVGAAEVQTRKRKSKNSKPDFIESLRDAANEQSEKWLRDYAEGLNLTYQDLMDGAKYWLRGGEYLVRGSNLEGECVADEFWEHYERISGVEVAESDRSNFFSCSC